MQISLTVDRPIRTADTTAVTADATVLQVDVLAARSITADAGPPTVDADAPTADADFARVPAGWPCARLPDLPPSVADRQSAPTADDLYPQIAGVLTPRGPAWGTDEAGDGQGASPVMRSVWRALAGWVAAQNAAEWGLATQCFPSAADLALAAWEEELGLPDPCVRGGTGQEARRAAVRARFGAQGGASPAYFACLAASIGYDITIEEPTQFLVDVSAVLDDTLTETWFRIDDGMIEDTPLDGFSLALSIEDGDEVVEDAFDDLNFQVDDGVIEDTPLESWLATERGTIWKTWVVHVRTLSETYFRIDESEVTHDPLEGFGTADDLECLLRRHAPQHTELVLAYAAA